MKKIVLLGTAILGIQTAFAAGFGLYEASARGNALGNSLVGKTYGDASANYYNAANIAESTNLSFMVGTTLLTPIADVTVDGKSQRRMNAGWFVIPTFFVTIPLPFDFALGWGNYAEYGLGTEYGNGWDLAADTTKTEMEQYTFNPNLAYKIFDWWSVGAGFRMSYITFENWKRPHFREPLYNSLMGTMYPYHLKSHLKGDDFDFGYNLATSFKILDNLSFGVNYRSRIRHNIKGDFDLEGNVLGVRQSADVPASAKLTLPQSVVFGFNWDVTDKLRLGNSVTWTEWSSLDSVNFKIPGYGYSLPLKWNDVWRLGFGGEYDVLDWLTLRAGYFWDMDPSAKYHGTTMLPPGDRHIFGIGLGWKVARNLRLDVGYNFILMEESSRDIRLTTMSGGVEKHRLETTNALSHLVSISLAYEF
jgi:long-chain fatty acid transport protein